MTPVERDSLLHWWRIVAVVSGVLASGCGSDAADGVDATPDPLAGVPACLRTVAEVFSAGRIDAPVANGNGFQRSSAEQRAALSESIALIVGGFGADGVTRATDAGYQACRDGSVVVWDPTERGTGRAVIAWRQAEARPLIVEAPHGVYDLMTLEESHAIFDGLGARALIASGTHRCANTAASGCDGTTSACGASEPYRESDMAHATETAFQVAHEVLSTHHATDWIVSVHGMGGAGASVSDGTTLATDAGAPVAVLGAAMASAFPLETITTCNAYPGANVDERLCGTTNTQGRFTNGSPAVCTAAATTSSGRFLHMEQSSAVRAATATVVSAFDQAVPAR